MNRTERLNVLLDLLSEEGYLDIDDIVSRLAVSPATARRDLDTLAEQQLLTRTRGGASAHSVAYDLPLRYKKQQHAEAKEAIARAASAMVVPGMVIGLCGGTTATAIAAKLVTRPDFVDDGQNVALTVVTNAINIAMQLATRPQVKTIVTGGVVHARSYELVGAFSDPVLGGLSLDLAFISANGMTADLGPTCYDEREAAVNASMARRAARAVLVVDSSKFGRRCLASVGDSDLFPAVVTDGGIDAVTRAELGAAGYEVIVAD